LIIRYGLVRLIVEKILRYDIPEYSHITRYFKYVACQKPYLTVAQVLARFLWAITHIFWTTEWLKVLWSNKVTFLVGGRTVKERYQFHRGHTILVNIWGIIGYGYKSPLLFIYGSGKKGAFCQNNYLSQVLAPHIEGIMEAFAAITHLLRPSAEPLFMEDSNSAHGHESIRNYYTRWYTEHGIILMPHPSTSPNINPIKKY
ncbi:uncharacterized protein K444DRAFT_619742, partial [Hyaloscypha bicolor E]